MKLLLLSLVAACAITTVYGEKVKCYECALTIINGQENGDDHCSDGEDTIDEDDTDSCSHGCIKIEFKMDMEETADPSNTFEVEYYGRGCDEFKEEDMCDDEDSAPNSDVRDLERLMEDIFPGMEATVTSLERCFCEGELCNSAPSGNAVNYFLMLTASIATLLLLRIT